MRNMNQYAKRLQRALLTKRLQINIDTNQFYSKEADRMITMYTLSTPVLQKVNDQWKNRKMEIMHTASQYDVVITLKEIWEAMEHWE